MSEVGRPLKFKSAKELQRKIEDYFKSCFEEQWFDEFHRDENGEWIKDKDGKRQEFHIKKKVQVEDFTITGLAIFLNTSRETLLDYQEKDEFSDTIKRAKLIIEKSYEHRLQNRGNAGDIFALKNFNWKDKTEVDNSITLKSAVSEDDKKKADKLINNYFNDNTGNSTIKK